MRDSGACSSQLCLNLPIVRDLCAGIDKPTTEPISLLPNGPKFRMHGVSTPFWPTGSTCEDPQPRPGALFITRQSEVNGQARGHGQTVRVDPTTLGTNDHHGHLEESLGYPRPPTLPQNSIGNLRGDVRPDLCQSGLSTLPFRSVWCHSGLFNGKQPGLSTLPFGSVWCHSGLFNGKQPKPDPSTVQPDS
ncbi:hypothetical protein CDL15_Pgr019844 [Punica granatum]|uniref:Uncharacterized protein n=1 Tax=Punica granatum TaxID=22663 RepID=A0A218WW63_PUNGR|nr:hypothetical protein CDL15_Pgr019844 [Punica granatum]